MCMVSGNGPDYWRVDSLVARVEHRCGECCRVIAKGEPFERHFTVYEGSGHSLVVCSHCAVLCDWLAINCDGWVYEHVVEDILEHARDYRRPDLARIAVMARNKWTWLRPGKHAFPGRPVPTVPRPIQLGDAA